MTQSQQQNSFVSPVTATPATVRAVRKVCDHVREYPGNTHPARELARIAGLSVSEFQRRFRDTIGVTPRQFVEAERLKHFKAGLRSTGSVLSSAMESGIGSSRGVHERSLKNLGMTAQQYGAGGEKIALGYASFLTPLGRVMLAATDRGLSFVHFGETHEQLLTLLRKEFPRASLHAAKPENHTQLQAWADALNTYLRGEAELPQLPVHVRATAFQQKVWKFLQTIPQGETRTYTQVAQATGNERAVRAVASACAANNIALLIPCHRVLRQGGALSGYRWGVERKRQLLDLEQLPAKQS